MFSLIAAVGTNYEIGVANKLIWNIPEDLKYFKQTTLNHKVVMGRKTYESIGKALPKRENFVITSKIINLPNVYVVTNLEEFIRSNKDTDEEIFIIGGSSIYEQFLPYATKLYLTEIEENCKEVDAFFPEFEKNEYLKNTISSNECGDIKYSFNIYIKK